MDGKVEGDAGTRSMKDHQLIAGAVMLACLIAAGAAAVSVFALRCSHKVSEEGAHVEEAGEVPAGSSVVYLKDGDIHYCACGPESPPARGVLVDEVPDIECFDASYGGDGIVYLLEDPAGEEYASLRENVVFYLYSPLRGGVRAFDCEKWHLYLVNPVIGESGDIWFSEHNGTTASTSIFRFSTGTGTKEKVAIYCVLIDLNPGEGRCLIERTELEQGGAISEVCLADLDARVIKNYSSARVRPRGWSAGKGHLIARRTFGGLWETGNEALLVSEDLEIIASYTVPEECGELEDFSWDEESGLLAFTTKKGRLYVADVRSGLPPRLLDSGGVRAPALISANAPLKPLRR